jgi:monothiol glutaredoxin
MKGDKYFPKCGYSRTVVEILNNYDIDFATYDILEDLELREALKSFSNWPTYPQLYIKSELIGGADIVSEIHLNGELESLIQ